MIILKRTNSENNDFQSLILKLDLDLAKKNGVKNDFFKQFNKTDLIKNVVVAFYDDLPVGCGAIKQFNNSTMEIKRMFVLTEMRGKGVATSVLKNLEHWTKELGYSKCILETGDKMVEAIELYKKNGFKIIQNYGQYENIEGSICFEKDL